MEAALDALARRVGGDVGADRQASPDRRRFPFDPRRRRMSVLVGDRLVVKGAPDSVLPCCSPVPGVAEVVHAMASRGRRVLAIAERPWHGPPPANPSEAEIGLELRGLVGIEDPPRPAAEGAVAACRGAGIRIAMVTGDHPTTAEAIAAEVGLIGVEDSPLIVSGAELPTDVAALGELLDRDGVVVARVDPEQKQRIALALRQRGHVVAMTGDGVNDAPALQEADIGVAMGRSGTDVAREAADLVLLDDDFATIVAAVEQGKATYSNIRRFLTYHLTDNVAELAPFVVWALSAGRIPLAIGVLQVLALDIGTDTLPAVALGGEPPDGTALRTPPDRGRLLDRAVAFRAFGLLGPVEAAFEMLAFFVVFWAWGWRPGDAFPGGDIALAASGAAFLTVVVSQFANAFACRSPEKWPGAVGWTTNRLLLGAIALESLLIAGFFLIPPVAEQLGHAWPTAAGWLAVACAPVALLVADATWKWRQRNLQNPI